MPQEEGGLVGPSLALRGHIRSLPTKLVHLIGRVQGVTRYSRSRAAKLQTQVLCLLRLGVGQEYRHSTSRRRQYVQPLTSLRTIRTSNAEIEVRQNACLWCK